MMIDALFLAAQNVRLEDKSVVFQATSLMDRYYNQPDLSFKPESDIFLTAYTALFIATKNSEVEPLSLSDIKNHFLSNKYTRPEILKRELEIRKAVNYENEVTSLFDYVMYYIKLWKMICQLKISDKNHWYVSTYKFICEVEQGAYDFTKSLLIDAKTTKYNASV